MLQYACMVYTFSVLDSSRYQSSNRIAVLYLRRRHPDRYYGYVHFRTHVDHLSSLYRTTVIVFPIRLIWSLQMPKAQKFGVISLFSIGIILIAVATYASMPSSSWIAFWGVIECSIAMIIECCPAYFILIHNLTTPTVSYNTYYFLKLHSTIYFLKIPFSHI
jgi:hypothetical protein